MRSARLPCCPWAFLMASSPPGFPPPKCPSPVSSSPSRLVQLLHFAGPVLGVCTDPGSGPSICCQCFQARSRKAFPFQMIPGFAFSSSCQTHRRMPVKVAITSASLSLNQQPHWVSKNSAVVVCLGLPVQRGLCNSCSVGLNSFLFLLCLGLNSERFNMFVHKGLRRNKLS